LYFSEQNYKAGVARIVKVYDAIKKNRIIPQ